MYNTIQDTLIIGKKVVHLPTCHSTNDIAAEIVHAGLFSEGTVVITDHQVAGRGQRGTTWIANANENLTFSLILTPNFLDIEEQFLISQSIALGIYHFLAKRFSDVAIKWPNDILVNEKKVCGILIENSIQGSRINTSIIGIGLNINQLKFQNNRITSLAAETGKQFALTEEFGELVRHLDAVYAQLRAEKGNRSIKKQYLKNLHGFGKPVSFTYQGDDLSGTVIDVDMSGLLTVKLADSRVIAGIGLKEISWFKN